MVGEALELATVCLARSPEVADGVSAIGRVLNPVDDVVLGLILQTAVMVQTPRAGPGQDVILKQVLGGGHIAVEEVGAAVVRPAVGQQVVVKPDVGVAVCLQPSLSLAITISERGASLQSSEVTCDVGSKIMHIVVLNIDIAFLELETTNISNP